LLTCAILILPISLAKSAAMALILAPTAVTAVSAHHLENLSQRTATDLQRQMTETDPAKRAALAQQQQKEIADLSSAWAETGTAAVGGLLAMVLGLVAVLVGIALMYGIAIPLVTGALTVIVADRATGGNAGPGQGYAFLFKRFGKLMSAGIPAFFLVCLGFLFLIIPGVVLAFLFVFVTPVVLLEDVGGTAALKRSVALVKANVLQVLVVVLVFAAIRIVAQVMTGILIPSSAFFFDSLAQDVVLMLLLPVPIIGTVLLYLDIRRQADGFDAQRVRAGLDGLRRS
ncbi:MAG: hypothetical protein ACREJ3_05640, partial [Polyangiaceae bacterium]